MSNSPVAAKPLADMQPHHPFFVGIDSDGCAFDSMEIKHKECFCPQHHQVVGPAAGLQVRPRSGRVRQPVQQVARHQPLAGAGHGL